jgi:hypothetical protein
MQSSGTYIMCEDIENSPIVVSIRRTIATSQCIFVDSMQEDYSAHMSRLPGVAEPGDSKEVTFLTSNAANCILETIAKQTVDVNNRIMASRSALYDTNKATFQVCSMMEFLRGNLYFTDFLR